MHPALNHHRRRSSAVAGTVGFMDQREDPLRPMGDGNTSKREEQKPLNSEDADGSDLSSIAESMEMGPMSVEDDHDDEETGLTANQRRQRRRRRKQRRHLDARIAGVKPSQQDPFTMGLADRNVLKKLLTNVALILLWYFFSLSISIVRSPLVFRDGVLERH